ncbi:MAG: hypothetical protein R3199_11230 [Gemmatimonadota bacterium]|nr:hypothetical protein [Gemmatimonadota bacterium]
MADEDPGTRFEEEIAEIEQRERTRNVFLFVGGIVVVVLAVIVVIGIRERSRLAELEARPDFEPVELGRHLGTVANTAVFSEGDRLFYVEGVGEAEIADTTEFVREIQYDMAGEPDSIPPGTTHWTLAQWDSLPYTIERTANPLIGVTPSDYRELVLSSLRHADYGAGGPNDWQPLEREEARVRVTGRAIEEQGSTYLREDTVQVRLAGVEELTPMDSLEVAWATENRAPLTAFGRIERTIPGGATLFVLRTNAVQPPEPEAIATPAGGAADTTVADTAPADTPNP